MNREGKKCVLYPRVSTEMQVDGYSLEGQKNSLKRFADREEMEIVGIYEDAGKSGKSIEGRPAFKKMLSDIKNGLEIDYILVYKLSRFGRNAADILNSLEFVQSYGINLICIEEGIDSSQTSGKLLISVLSAVAEIERENIIEQTMNGRREKARQGGWNGGFAPYGYYLKDNQLLIEETEAEAIRIIFDKFANSDIGLGGVAKYLNLQGIKKIPRQNGTLETWSSHFIRLILDNPVYCGKIAYGRRTREKVKGTKNEYKQVHAEDYILEDGQHEGIISEELWQKVHAKRMATGIKQPSKIGKDRSHLLTGILKCPLCGSSMYTNKHAWTNKDGTYKEVYYYICGRNKQERGHHCDYKASLRKTDIEPLVIEAVKELVSDKYFAKEIEKRIGVQTDTTAIDKELANYESKLKEVDLNKARLEREIDNLPIDARFRERKIHDMTLRLDGLYDTIVELEERIEDAKLRKSSIEMETITLDNIYKLMLNFGKLYDIISDEEKKSLITYLIKEIQIYPNGESEQPLKSIEFNFPIYRDGQEVRRLLWEKGNTVEEYVGVTGGSSATNDTDGPTETGGTGSVYIGAAPTEDKPIPDPAGENPTKPGTLVWDIGDMAANETRTLTYRVKLKDAYTGVTAKGNLQNTANVYSKTYQRDSDTVTFTPSVGATMSKVASTFTPGENGGGTITYTIWVKANADNGHVLDNVKIMDALDGSIENQNRTSAPIRQYLSYDANSFHLYQGGSNGQNGSSGLTEITAGTTLNITDTDNDGRKNDSFTYYVGSLAPGESKTLTYTVNVEPGVFVAAGNKDFRINNRACIYTDDSRTDGGVWLKGYNTSKTINRKVWSRKLAGGKQETESTVSMSGSVYDATGSSVTQITSPDSSFTVPAGSYKYQVAANEAGDWDLSSASMADSLGSQYMEFVGYVRVEAYTISSNAPGSGLDDAAAIANLSGRTPDQTVWVKVDGKTSFSFTPVQIGLNGTQAYLLTYYAQPTNIDGITQVVVSNRFELTGEVVIGNFRYVVLTGIGAEASVVVKGSNSFAAEKQSWYYEKPKVTTGDFANGALYWVIKVDGTVLPSGTAIKDVTNAVGGSAHYIRDTSFVGVYTGNLETNSLADYADLDSLIASDLLTALESSNYTVAKSTYSLTLTLNTEIPLAQGDSLYLIVKTEPSQLPAKKRDAFTYNNKLQSRSDSTNWLDHNTASKTLYGSENIFKELGRVFYLSRFRQLHHGHPARHKSGHQHRRAERSGYLCGLADSCEL